MRFGHMNTWLYRGELVSSGSDSVVRRGTFHRAEDMQQSRLTAPGRATNGDEFTPWDAEGDIVQCLNAAFGALIDLAETSDLDETQRQLLGTR